MAGTTLFRHEAVLVRDDMYGVAGVPDTPESLVPPESLLPPESLVSPGLPARKPSAHRRPTSELLRPPRRGIIKPTGSTRRLGRGAGSWIAGMEPRERSAREQRKSGVLRREAAGTGCRADPALGRRPPQGDRALAQPTFRAGRWRGHRILVGDRHGLEARPPRAAREIVAGRNTDRGARGHGGS